MKVNAEVVRTITVEMNDYDAEVILNLCRNIGGDPKGPRGVWNELADGLVKAGVKCREFEFRHIRVHYEDSDAQ